MNRVMFEELSLDEKANNLWSNGHFISARTYYNQKILLYSLKNFYVEVWYSPNENVIANISPLDNMKTFSLYFNPADN